MFSLFNGTRAGRSVSMDQQNSLLSNRDYESLKQEYGPWIKQFQQAARDNVEKTFDFVKNWWVPNSNCAAAGGRSPRYSLYSQEIKGTEMLQSAIMNFITISGLNNVLVTVIISRNLDNVSTIKITLIGKETSTFDGADPDKKLLSYIDSITY
jgi:hypothetical protein